MITHRMSTRMQPGPPVRFYRTIAITFLVLTIVLLGVVIFFTSKKATIVVVAKSDNKNVNLSIDVLAAPTSGSAAVKGIVTSTEFNWSEQYYPTSNKVSEGQATGQVTVYNDSSIVQPLVQTTRLLSAKGVLFRLSEGVTVPANGQVTAQVYADQKGASGDIDATTFTIPGLTKDRQQYIYAKSTQKMSGGVRKVGILTADDLQAAKNNFTLKVKQAFLENTSSVLTDMERVVLVKGGLINTDKSVGDEIDGFKLSGTSTVVVVYYNKSDLISIVNGELSKKIDSGSEKVLSVNRSPQVNLANYDLSNRTARLSVYQDVLVTLDANGDKLAGTNFFGKNKDEIQRYIMGLGHVVGVETKFSPSWMRKAPSATDKIKVVVKNVQ